MTDQPKFQQGLGRRSEEILFALRHDLDCGIYAPGDTLPSESELCARFETSRGTVRRAIARLAADKRIAPRQGVGHEVLSSQASQSASRIISAMLPTETQNLDALQQTLLQNAFLLCNYSQANFSGDLAYERKFLEQVHAQRHHGLLAVCSPIVPYNEDLIHAMAADGIRIIHMEPYRAELPDESFYFADYRRAGYFAATKLMAAGYETLVWVHTKNPWPAACLVEQGWREAIADHRGQDAPTPTVAFGDTKQMDAMLDTSPPNTAFFCQSQNMGIFLKELSEQKGITVPEEFGFLSVQYIPKASASQATDMLVFDWQEAFLKAANALLDTAPLTLRDWHPPQLCANGTVRQ